MRTDAYRTVTRLALIVGIASVVLACRDPEPRPPSLVTRVHLDRAEMTVGDAIGVTIEIETPTGFSIEAPVAPSPNDHFTTESIRGLDPVPLAGAMRNRLLWTLRARGVGSETLPALQVPLVRPDGETVPLAIGNVPISVLSVRGDFPEREVWFDIQPPPEPDGYSELWWGSGAGLVLLTAAIALFGVRRRRAQEPPPPTRAELEREAWQALEEALEEPDARALAHASAGILWTFVESRYGQSGPGRTAEELPEGDEPALARVLIGLESARFQRAPARDDVLRMWRDARALFRDDGP